MALSVTGEQVESVLRRLLPQRGYELLNKPRMKGETGADIISRNGDMQVFIECIGFQERPPIRSKQFYEVFFRAISRLKDGADRCVIALPLRFKRGMNQRANHYGEAWKRIGNAFPELEMWFVNVKGNIYEEHSWNDWPEESIRNIVSSSIDIKAYEVLSGAEELHLHNCNENVKDIYHKIKKEFLSTKNSLQFNTNPQNYIGVKDKKQIAYIQPEEEKLRLIVRMNEKEVQVIVSSGHHQVLKHSKKIQKYWGGKDPNCSVEICDKEYWDEIRRLIEHLVKKYEQK